MYLAVELGNIDLNPVFKGALATILYFLVGTAVLILGFVVVDVLTPGKLRQLVFIDRRPNAVMLACANYIALAAVIISAITNSYSKLGQGLVGVAVYGLIGVVLQGVAILSMHFVIPGDFHEHIDEPELASGGVRHGGDAAGRGRSDRCRAVMTSTEQQPDSPTHQPATSTRWRAVLLASVAACAACGIIYELALLTLSTSLNGGGIVATSLIVAGYIAALGAGALLVKPLLRWAAIAFVAVEAVLAIVGGLSAAALYVMFSFVGGSLLMLALGTALIGALVGAEVPLLMTLLQRGDPLPKM